MFSFMYEERFTPLSLCIEEESVLESKVDASPLKTAKKLNKSAKKLNKSAKKLNKNSIS